MDFSVMGSKIKEERKRQGLTLEALSEQIGISKNFLWEIEAGRKAPALNTLYNLGATLHISVDYLMGLSNERTYVHQVQYATKRDQEISQIGELLNQFGAHELALIFNIINDFAKYLKT